MAGRAPAFRRLEVKHNLPSMRPGKQVTGGAAIKALALQFLIVGILYPCAAGLGSSRQTLYMNLYVDFLGFTAWILATRLLNRVVEQTDADAAVQPV